jgi:hypothetical protein
MKELTQSQEKAIAKLEGIIYYYAQIETEDHTPYNRPSHS